MRVLPLHDRGGGMNGEWRFLGFCPRCNRQTAMALDQDDPTAVVCHLCGCFREKAFECEECGERGAGWDSEADAPRCVNCVGGPDQEGIAG